VADASGRFGPYGGRYVPETLMHALEELAGVYDAARADPRFWTELDFPEAPAVREQLKDRLLTLPQSDPMVRMACERLGRADR